jgi:hypothetical protein
LIIFIGFLEKRDFFSKILYNPGYENKQEISGDYKMNSQNKLFPFWVLLIILWGGLNLQAVVVSTTQELVNAVSNANTGGDKEIVLQNGTYTLNDMLIIEADGVTVRSQSGNRNSVIIQGQGMKGGVSHIFNVEGSNFTVRNMTIGWVANHAIQIHGEDNSSNTLISNLRIVDTNEQMVKISYESSNPNSSENGIMENCLLEYSDGVGPQYYIGGIDGHQCKNWTVRNNVFKNFSSPSEDVAEHAVHFWSDSQDTLVENNLIINCDRGIGFGLGSRGHIRGIIRNNMIYHSSTDYGFADVAIGLENASNARVYNNTIYMENTYPNAIEYRFSGTSGGIIKNNLCNKAIISRDGGSADLSNNITNAQAGWFVNVAAGNLHLASQVSQVVDQGVFISGLTGDYDGDSRPQGSGIDIGADEYVAAGAASITVTSPNGGESWQVGSNHAITWSSTGTVGNVNIEYSTNNGSNWSTITSSTANDGSYWWTIPNTVSSLCLVRISEAADGNPMDTNNNVFSIKAAATSTLTVISPNGNESLVAGTTRTITWTTSGTVGNVKIEYSINNGSSWSLIKSSTANDGSYNWTVPNAPSSQCLIKISEASDGSPSDISDGTFSIYSFGQPKISISRNLFNFGAVGSKVTGAQTLLIDNSGNGTLNWSVSDNKSWLSVSPSSGTNSGVVTITANKSGLSTGSYYGTITISDPIASNSPKKVDVRLRVYNTGSTANPFGDFATPTHGSTVRSSIPVTGWVLDDIEVKSVKIYNGSNYIGDAVFVEGARPDVESAYPDYPKNYQAGWGYMMLTNFLPGGGNGTYTIRAKATDAEGNTVTLGSKTIIVDNANAVKPFGAIDAPTQGGTVSGGNFINWGWVLTPQPNTIPIDGSTINVIVDGVNIGHPAYNNYRADIAGLFPSYNNSNGAVGYFYLDTTVYENGVHTIQWTATDNAGNTDGIGSRYFTIQNKGTQSKVYSAQHNATHIPTSRVRREQARLFRDSIRDIPIDYSEPIRIKKGYNKNIEPREIYPDNNGIIIIEIKELERLEIHFYDPGKQTLNIEHRTLNLSPLPIGSTLDAARGVFYWSPGPGFLGDYEFVFVDISPDRPRRLDVIIKIFPKYR